MRRFLCAMPYVLTFVKPVTPTDREQYINDCCVGGDLVLAQLLPALRERYGEIEPDQEDWGWFAWFEHAGLKLAVDVHTHDAETGAFAVHLTSRRPRWLLWSDIRDTPELDALRDLVAEALRSWAVTDFTVERVDDRYLPV